jgi:hypothetical protein
MLEVITRFRGLGAILRICSSRTNATDFRDSFMKTMQGCYISSGREIVEGGSFWGICSLSFGRGDGEKWWAWAALLRALPGRSRGVYSPHSL